ncbi:superoxide dismutase [Longispora sp. NPDC051575]|uniref:SMP-30/gluconolactonase/LRE family protein n=1 Tax=Longispora sp. NPDC051575 TaxID=3154943 RepID=UPI00343AA54D
MDRRTLLRTGVAALAATAGATTPGSPASAHQDLIREYVVTREPGASPEGIEVTRDGTMYVTSVATGAVYRGHVCDRALRPFLAPGADGRTSATGVKLDRRDRLFVAGAATGTLFVYDRSGRPLTRRAVDAPASFLNDMAFTSDAVYVTDSVNQTVWRASLTGDRVGPLTPWLTVDAFDPVPSFLNGIVTSADGRVLLVAEQGVDVTYRVDLATRAVRALRIADGRAFSGDGLVLEGRRLYGVWNRLNAAGEWEFLTRLVELNRDFTAARVLGDSAAVAGTVGPTTLARDRGRLLWVNSQLPSGAGTPPYLVTEVPGLR